jgi:NAD(P)-dependent dehydrogenase (short-subunit alcohol dehydrogenase family)
MLITGCSSGIGRAIALEAVRQGFTTMATSRDTEALRALQADGCLIRCLDVADPDARQLVVDELIDAYGGVDVLVNNAGYAELGPFEDVPLTRWQVQFETNLFGPVGLIQLVLPGMRARGYGRIVNISSMAGELVLPVGAPYHASKFALEAATEVLRLEVRRFGIGVSLVQPGSVNTRLAKNMPALERYACGVYGDLVTELEQQLARRLPRGLDPSRVAAMVLRAVRARRPRTRYRVGLDAHVLMATRPLLPSELWARCLSLQFPALRPSALSRPHATRAVRDGQR